MKPIPKPRMILVTKSIGTELEKQYSSQPKKKGMFTRIMDNLRPKNSTRILDVTLPICSHLYDYLLLLDLCTAIAFKTVFIGAKLNAQSGLGFNENEASWLGKTKAAFVSTIYRVIHRTQDFRLSITLKYLKFWN
jgi:hypothetical protein